MNHNSDVKLLFRNGLFECYCHFDQRDIPKKAGFYWKMERRCWVTDNWAKANLLKEYADSKTLTAINERKSAKIDKVLKFSYYHDEAVQYRPKGGRINRVRHR